MVTIKLLLLLIDHPPKQFLRDKLLDHKAYIQKYVEDMPEIRDWQWS